MIEVRPIDRLRWHGKKGAESFSQPQVIEALVDPATQRFKTGLTEGEAIELGGKLGINLSDIYTGEPHPFYSQKQAWVSLVNRTFFLNPENPIEFLKIKMIKADERVANSQSEYDRGLYPNATHVIYDEEDEMAAKAVTAIAKSKAYRAVAELSAETQSDILHIITGKSVRGKSPNFLIAKFEQEIESNPVEVMRVIKMGSEEAAVRAKVLELMYRNILMKGPGGITYMGDIIALNYEDAVQWFKDPSNSKLKVMILEQLEKKMVVA